MRLLQLRRLTSATPIAVLVLALAFSETTATALAEPKDPRREPTGGLPSREPSVRQAMLEAHGGNEKTEKAVQDALRWIARHQSRDGSWSLHEFSKRCRSKGCDGPASFKSDAGATALALLPLLGAGMTHKQLGPYRKHIHQGLYWLLRQQKQNGDLRAGSVMYAHGLAALALCEAYGLTSDRTLGQAAQKSVDFIVSSQNPTRGGWRYEPGQAGDTSATGWQLSALHSAKAVGLKVDAAALDQAKVFLKSCSQGQGGKFSYMLGNDVTPSTTAVGLLCCQYTGMRRDDPAFAEGQDFLMANTPDRGERNLYYWFYASQALRNLGGRPWQTWNEQVQKALLESQVGGETCAAGSWDPASPTNDLWGPAGGRLMITSLACLTLEVYYRYTPVYQEK